MQNAKLHATAGRRVIVGVLGRTFVKSENVAERSKLDEKSKGLLAQAQRVGVLLTQFQHIVLTGGTLLRPEISVKFDTLLAARTSGNWHAIARIIGILPDDISKALNVEHVISEKIKSNQELSLYLHTQLSGSERDKVTGTAADVFIALQGKHGTPREVAAALGAGRPVVFLNSIAALEKSTREELDLQGYGSDSFPRQPLVASEPDDAVEAALRAVGTESPQSDLRSVLRQPDEMARWPPKLSAEPRLLAQLAADVQLLVA